MTLCTMCAFSCECDYCHLESAQLSLPPHVSHKSEYINIPFLKKIRSDNEGIQVHGAHYSSYQGHISS